MSETLTPPAWLEQRGPALFVVRRGGGARTIEFVRPGVVRLSQGEAPAPPSSAVLADCRAPVEAGIAADGTFEGGGLRVSLDEQGAARIADGTGRALFEEVGFAGRAAGGWTLELSMAPGERFYGFGEKNGRLDKRGASLTFWNTDPFGDADGGYPPGTDPLYVSIPFFVGLREGTAWGLLVDDPYRLRMDLSGERLRIEADGGQPELYFVAGPSVPEVVSRYSTLTGRIPLPPRWALGYHQCRWGWWPDREVHEIGQEFRRRGIPADCLWLDIQHLDDFRVFSWDPKGFPRPRELIADLLEQGFKTTVIVDPGIKVDPSWALYAQGEEQCCWVTRGGKPYVDKLWAGDCVFPDFSSARVRRWWASLMPRATSVGVQGVWLDMNEPATVNRELGRTLPNDCPADGDGTPTTLAGTHNLYALHEADATWAGLRSAVPERRPFILTRAGSAGIQRYAALWTGDAPSRWETLRETLPMLLGLGLSGVPFVGSDVGGFSGRASPELFARWMQLGAFSPFFRGHCSIKGQRQEPWQFGEEVEAICRDVIRERYRLLPYLYSLFDEAARSGAPILRPMVYDFQGDPETHALDDQAMLGPWLLVAPVLEAGVTRRRVYLPRGLWADYWSGSVHQGGRWLEVEAPLARIPLFVREGAIVPTASPVAYTELQEGEPRELWLFPSVSATRFALYDDDGDGPAHEQGGFSRRIFETCCEKGGVLLRAGAAEGRWTPPAGRRLRVALRWGAPRVGRVLLDGRPLPRLARGEELCDAEGWAEGERGCVVSLPETAWRALELLG